MTKKTVDLQIETPAAWLETVLARFDEFLADHANCERKASALALSMVVKYPDRHKIIPDLIELAQEELSHFAQVYTLMASRGLSMAKDTPDPYVNQLIGVMRHGREERFLDRLLVASIVECRGAERFRLISQGLSDVELKRFYRDLWASEARHGNVFVDLALRYFEAGAVYPRLEQLAEQEARIVRRLEVRPALH